MANCAVVNVKIEMTMVFYNLFNNEPDFCDIGKSASCGTCIGSHGNILQSLL